MKPIILTAAALLILSWIVPPTTNIGFYCIFRDHDWVKTVPIDFSRLLLIDLCIITLSGAAMMCRK